MDDFVELQLDLHPSIGSFLWGSISSFSFDFNYVSYINMYLNSLPDAGLDEVEVFDLKYCLVCVCVSFMNDLVITMSHSFKLKCNIAGKFTAYAL